MQVSAAPEKLGSPYQPIELKCMSIGRPGDGNDYLCMVTQGGMQIYVRLRPTLEGLLRHQLRGD